MVVIGLLLVASIIVTIKHNPKGPGFPKAGTSSIDEPSFTSIKTIEKNGTWGYEIYFDTVLFIYQDYIPGIPGNIGFSSREDAIKCAELVLKKIEDQKAPGIYKEELDSLGIKY